MDSNNPYRLRWLAFCGLGMALLILNLDATIVNLALPVLGHEFHVGLSSLAWVNNVYTLTSAALMMLGGKVADRYGHKRLFLYGMVFFLIGSIIAGSAFYFSMLIIGRMLQGIGMAATFSMVFILVNKAFPENTRGYATGLLVLFTGVAQAAGPTIGGLIVEYLGWQYAFYINIPFSVFGYFVVRYTCHPDNETHDESIHYPSGVLLAIAYVLLVFACNEMRQLGLTSPTFQALIGAGLVMIVGVFVWQTRLKSPFLSLDLFRQRDYLMINLVRPLFQLCFGAFFFVFPLYLQNINGMTPSNSGMLMLIMTVFLAIAALVTSKLNDRIAPRRLIIFSQILAVIGYTMFATMSIIPIVWVWMTIALICVGVNVGVMYSSSNYLVIKSLPANKKGIGFGFVSSNTFFFYSIGIGLGAFVLGTVSFAHFSDLVSQHSLQVMNLPEYRFYVNGAHSIQNMLDRFPDAQPLVPYVVQAFTAGFHAVMGMFAGISVLALLLCFV